MSTSPHRHALCALLLSLAGACASSVTVTAGDASIDAPSTDAVDDRATGSRCPARRAAHDFNGDGVDDLAVVTRAGVRTLHGTRGRLALVAGPTLPLPPGLVAEGAALSSVGDLDGDGTSELAVYAPSSQPSDMPGAPWRPGALFVYEGGRVGLAATPRAVAPPTELAAWFPQQALAGGRLFGGDRGALAVSLSGDRGVLLYTRTPEGSYGVAGAGALTHEYFARSAGDVDGDGYDDLAVAAEDAAALYDFHVAPGAPPRRRTLYTDAPNRVGPYHDGVGDVTGDGCADTLLLSFGDARGFVLYAGGARYGDATPWRPLARDGRPIDVNGATDFLPAGDADGDGLDDVIVVGGCFSGAACPEDHTERALYRGTPAGLSTTPTSVLSLLRGLRLRVAGDLDGDGRADLVEYAGLARGPAVWRGTAAGYVPEARVAVDLGRDVESGAVTGSAP